MATCIRQPLDMRTLAQVGQEWLKSDENVSISVRYAVPNDAWFVMWGDSHILHIFTDKREAYEYVAEMFADGRAS